VNMMARRNPNKAPRNAVVIIMLGEDTFLPPVNKKPAYARARVQRIIRRYMGNHLVGVIVPRIDPGTATIFALWEVRRFGKNECAKREADPAPLFVQNGLAELSCLLPLLPFRPTCLLRCAHAVVLVRNRILRLGPPSESAFDAANKLVNLGRFHKIIVYFFAHGLHSSFKSRVSRQENGYTIGMDLAHGTDYGKAIAFLADVKVREQDIKLVIIDLC